MVAPGEDDDLTERIADLERQLEQLRDELVRPRGPTQFPRPPTPGELIRFADRHAIPTAIAVLEANIRALELLQGSMRLFNRDLADGDSSRRAQGKSLDRAALDRVDRALSDLQRAAKEGALPRQEDARDIIEEARRIRADIADRIEESEAVRRGENRPANDDDGDSGRGTTIDVDSVGGDPSTGSNGEVAESSEAEVRSEIDVEEELEAIKEELERELEEDLDDHLDADSRDRRRNGKTGTDQNGGGDRKSTDGSSAGITDGEDGDSSENEDEE